MARIRVDAGGGLRFPPELGGRYRLGAGEELLLEETEAGLVLHPLRPDVRRFDFPSCVDCDLRDTCDITAANDGCWGWYPSCADCLWAQGIIRCP